MPNPSGSVRAAQRLRRARAKSDSRSLWRRAAAVLTTLALAGGLAVVGAAAPASAHHNTITATAVCASDGKTATVTWKIQNSEDVRETITSSSMTKVVAVGTKIASRATLTAVQTGAELGKKYTLELKGKWDNGNTATNSGSFTVPNDICAGSEKITICHATGSDKNPYERIEIAPDGIAGHDDHKKDIWAAFSYKKGNKTIKVAAQGDQRLLPDCVKPPTEIDVPAKPASQDKCGIDNDKILEPKKVTGVEWEISAVANGKATATATTKPGYTFAGGTTSKTYDFEFSNVPCPIEIPVPAEPGKQDECGVGNDKIIQPDAITGVVWEIGDVVNGTAIATATTISPYTFPDKKTSKTYTLTFTDKPCPPTIVTIHEVPTSTDICGPDNGVLPNLDVPEGAHYRFEQSGSEAEGQIIVTAIAAKGYAFDEGQQTTWTFHFVNTPCVIAPEPTSVDVCGLDNDRIELPEAVEHLTWRIEGDERDGVATAIATTDEGYEFADGTSTKSVQFTFTNVDCIEPALTGSTAVGQCVADAPWIFTSIQLDDPDHQVTSRLATLELSDGTNSTTIELGELDDSGKLEKKVLWPGASVGSDGVTATGWPGWKQVDGVWEETDDNFAWTRDIDTAVLKVNPDLVVDLVYPDATPECAEPGRGGGEAPPTPPAGGGDGDGDTTVTAESDQSGLASTGFAGTAIAIVAGIIVLAGAAFLVIARVRRKRA